MLKRLHARIGDLWWYSAMLFAATRIGDVIQAFIGLWLVPRYVGADELGAVLPLQHLCMFFAMPLAAIAVVFSKYVNTYANSNDYGKVRSFVRHVILASTCVFLVCIAAAWLTVPLFYERLRIEAGMLTVLILLSGFSGNISTLLGNALQGLKMFNSLTFCNLISAPIRLVTLLIAMPFRPLSGYILGQTTPQSATSLFAAFSLHRKLKHVVPDSSWRIDLPRILRYFWSVLAYCAFSTLFSTVIITVYRQRLPEIESAAYYLLSRFAETAGYLGVSMAMVLFPLAAEAHENGLDSSKIIKRTLYAISASTVVITAIFIFASRLILSINSTWSIYLPFADLLPLMTLACGLQSAVFATVNYEMARRRFGYVAWVIVANGLLAAFLVSFTGYEFFRGIVPNQLVDWMSSLNIASLSKFVWINLGVSTVLAASIPFAVSKKITRTRTDTGRNPA